jgi:hypothetical protein
MRSAYKLDADIVLPIFNMYALTVVPSRNRTKVNIRMASITFASTLSECINQTRRTIDMITHDWRVYRSPPAFIMHHRHEGTTEHLIVCQTVALRDSR